VTGTNGKTSTAAFVAAAVSSGRPVVRAVTTGFYLGDEELEVPKSYQGFLAAMRIGLERGARHAAVELTSEALFHGFIKAWPCRVGVFTNLTRDHMNWHGSVEHYLASKAQLFMHLPAGGAAILNACDPASELLAEVVPHGVRLLRYGVPTRGPTPEGVDLAVDAVAVSWSGTHLTLRPGPVLGTMPPALHLRAIGEVQAENALAALAAAVACDVPVPEALHALSHAPAPPGRFEVVSTHPHVVVDYAHTPDALRRTLQTARKLGPARLTVVFGAGGHRDREKRPMLGEAATLADRIIITTDNPRDEDPEKIAAAIREGAGAHHHVEEIPDRRSAIWAALSDAGGDDIVLVAGKGHETQQSVSGVEVPLSDVEIVRSFVIGQGVVQ
jgi:UDP-N-acetylmuramoyl-L-alanyl-D-glutamate--2,6-diaminopimelate ligase